MTIDKGKTWTALMLAASTLALTAAPLAAQEATTEDPAADLLLLEEGQAAAEGGTAAGEGAEADAEAGTELAAEEGAEPDATVTAEGGTDATVTAEGGTDATVTAEGEAGATGAEAETEVAADDAAGEDMADDTMTAEGEAPADGTGTAEGEVDATLTADGEIEAGDAEAGTDVAADETAGEDLAAEGAETDVAAGDTADEDGTDVTIAAEGDDADGGTIIIVEEEGDDATLTAEGEAGTEGAAETDMAAETGAETDAEDMADDAMTAEGEAMEAQGTETAEGEAMEADAAMTADAGAVANPPEEPNADMQAVLDQLAELGALPISELSVEEARSQPTPADAVMAVMEERGTEMPAELAGLLTRDITYPGADGSQIPARVYTPEGEGPFPLIVYFHGGGWVIAGIDVYDASARALAAGAEAVVVSATYRQAPETLFPAQHEDANAAYEWIVENSGELNADAERLAVVGESAGGNLAVNVAIHARDAALVEPDHVVAVYPIASDDMALPSYEAYADAMPLSRDGMMWFYDHVFADPSQAADPRIDLIARDDLAGLPPTTIVNAEIDPLHSEGEILAERLRAAGVEVEQMTYPGVAHEFFGMGTVVPQAQEAVDMVTANLREAFGSAEAEGLVNADGATAGEMTDVETTAAETPDAMATEGEAAPDN